MAYEIAHDGYSAKEIEEIVDILQSDDVTIKQAVQFEYEALHTLLIILTLMGKEIVLGIGNSIGRDIWEKLKKKLSTKNNSNIQVIIRNDSKSIQLTIPATESSTILIAFDSAENAIQQTSTNTTSIKLFFDTKTQKWIEIKKRPIARKITSPVMDTNPIKTRNREYKFPKTVLEQLASKMIGKPVTLGHGGKQIGEITNAWVEGETLYHELGIYEGLSDEDSSTLEDILRSGGGVSMGITGQTDE